jgi:hypothetical protein
MSVAGEPFVVAAGAACSTGAPETLMRTPLECRHIRVTVPPLPPGLPLPSLPPAFPEKPGGVCSA